MMACIHDNRVNHLILLDHDLKAWEILFLDIHKVKHKFMLIKSNSIVYSLYYFYQKVI